MTNQLTNKESVESAKKNIQFRQNLLNIQVRRMQSSTADLSLIRKRERGIEKRRAVQTSLLGDDESVGGCGSSGTGSSSSSTDSGQGVEGRELLHQQGASLLDLQLLLLELKLLLQTGNFEGVTTEAVQNFDFSAELVSELDGTIDINEHANIGVAGDHFLSALHQLRDGAAGNRVVDARAEEGGAEGRSGRSNSSSSRHSTGDSSGGGRGCRGSTWAGSSGGGSIHPGGLDGTSTHQLG